MIKFIVGLTLTAFLTGCASSADVRNAPLTVGTSKDFNASFSQVKRLALESVQGLNVDVKSANELGNEFTIEFAKSMTAFSWGEVGRVAVVDVTPNSRVTVFSEKRSRLQITGTGEDEFARAIFDGIQHGLNSN